MIIEGLIATLNADGSPHLTAMGPRFDDWERDEFELRPYVGSTTLVNLLREGEGVFHLTDDVPLLVRAALGQLDSHPDFRAARHVRSIVVPSANQWLEFKVERTDLSEPRHRLDCRVVHREVGVPFRGLNRARHALLEAAILATRVTLISWQEILEQFESLWIPVSKTSSADDAQLWNWLVGHVERLIAERLIAEEQVAEHQKLEPHDGFELAKERWLKLRLPSAP